MTAAPRTIATVALVLVLVANGVVACRRDEGSTTGTVEGGSLRVVPTSAQLTVGESAQLRAAGSAGHVVWSSSNPLVATVEFGKVIGTGAGSATIRAVSGGSRADASIIVVAPVPTPSYSGDIYPIIISRGCGGCHGGAEGVSFASVTTSYDLLITRRTNDEPNPRLLVQPGDSLASYLFGQVKNLGVPAFDNMPPGANCSVPGPSPRPGNCLSIDEIRLLGLWIQQGARRDP